MIVVTYECRVKLSKILDNIRDSFFPSIIQCLNLINSILHYRPYTYRLLIFDLNVSNIPAILHLRFIASSSCHVVVLT